MAMESSQDDAAERAREYVALQASRLRALGPAAGKGDDDAVHDARTATRRLRTALGVCSPLVADAARLGDELRDVGRTLGAARDPAVELAWFREALDSLPDDDVRVRARLVESRLAARQAGLLVLRRQLRSAAHAHLLAQLDAAVADAWPPDEGAIVRRAAREWRRLDRALAAIDEGGRDERDVALHAARRQARRARYASEVVGPDAKRSVDRAEQLQEALGTHHDAVLVRAILAEVALQARAAGEDTSAYDRLTKLADDSADQAEHAARRAAHRAGAAGHRAWMT
jgi:CHAD domain-containing protein